jgi:hypothetical protein
MLNRGYGHLIEITKFCSIPFLISNLLQQSYVPNPADSIPLPIWQRELYFRSASWSFATNILHTIFSTFNLIENATHMPFPSHISSLLSSSIHLFQQATELLANYAPKQQQNAQPNTIIAKNSSLQQIFSTLSLSNELSTSVFYHHELLPQLFFPFEQTLAIYAPFLVPIIVPILTICLKIIIKSKKGQNQRDQTQQPQGTSQTTTNVSEIDPVVTEHNDDRNQKQD